MRLLFWVWVQLAMLQAIKFVGRAIGYVLTAGIFRSGPPAARIGGSDGAYGTACLFRDTYHHLMSGGAEACRRPATAAWRCWRS